MYVKDSKDSEEPRRDILTFDQGMISSQLLTPDEFQPARFTVTLTEDAAPTWEAMQSSLRAGVAFWRGELHGEEMRGVLSTQPLEGSSTDFLFVGHRMVSSNPSVAPP